MALVVDRYLDELLCDAERLETCLFVTSGKEWGLLAGRVRSGELVNPRRGLYARAAYWRGLNTAERALHMARALGILHQRWVFSHATAAYAHGLWASWRYADPLHYRVGGEGTKVSEGIVRHGTSWSVDVWESRCLRVTSPADTLFDCSVSMPLRDALPVVDSAVRLGVLSRPALVALCEASAGRRGARMLRRVVGHVDERSESGGESFVRGVLLEQGYRIADLQRVVPDIERPGHTRRLDIVLERRNGGLLDLEVDGRQKYEDERLTRGRDLTKLAMDERRREAGITALGYSVMRTTPRLAAHSRDFARRLARYGVFPEGASE